MYDKKKFSNKSPGEPPVSDMRAIILVKKLTNYCDFVIKYFMSPQNIGENKVRVKIQVFFAITVHVDFVNFFSLDECHHSWLTY